MTPKIQDTIYIINFTEMVKAINLLENVKTLDHLICFIKGSHKFKSLFFS